MGVANNLDTASEQSRQLQILESFVIPFEQPAQHLPM